MADGMVGSIAPELPAGFARVEHFASVGSTNDVVRGWLANGVPEIAVAVADEQTAGRGRNGRTWTSSPGATLLVSLGFRPGWLDPDRTWRLAGIVALGMADAAEEAAGLAPGAIRLKWPNDLVVTGAPRAGKPVSLLKLAGILGETDGLGTNDPRAVVGIGINVDWAATDFPPELAATMTSLREASGGRPVDRGALLEAFLTNVGARAAALRKGRFDVPGWVARQATTGHVVELSGFDGSTTTAVAVGVDGATGALIVEDAEAPGSAERRGPDRHRMERRVLTGEVVRLRLPSTGPV